MLTLALQTLILRHASSNQAKKTRLTFVNISSPSITPMATPGTLNSSKVWSTRCAKLLSSGLATWVRIAWSASVELKNWASKVVRAKLNNMMTIMQRLGEYYGKAMLQTPFSEVTNAYTDMEMKINCQTSRKAGALRPRTCLLTSINNPFRRVAGYLIVFSW